MLWSLTTKIADSQSVYRKAVRCSNTFTHINFPNLGWKIKQSSAQIPIDTVQCMQLNFFSWQTPISLQELITSYSKKVTFYTRPILNDNQNPGSHLSPFAKRQQKCFLIKGQAITGFGFFEAALDDRRCFTTNFTRFNRQSSIFFLVTQYDVFIAKCLFLGTVIFFSSSIQRVGSRTCRDRLTRLCLCHCKVNLEHESSKIWNCCASFWGIFLVSPSPS